MKHILTSMDHTIDFLRSTYALDPKCSDELLKTEDYAKAEDIINVEKLVHDIIQSEGVLFSINEDSCDVDGRSIRKYIACKKPHIFNEILHYIDSDVFKLITFSFPVHIFNPYFQLFIKNVGVKLGFDHGKYFRYDTVYKKNINDGFMIRDNERYAPRVDMLNAFIDSIRLEAESQEFKKTINKYQRRAKDNYGSLMKYINNLFDEDVGKNARLMVLRVDFGYEENDLFTNEKWRNAKFLQAQGDRVRLFNNRRSNKIFKHMLGYAWKLEYSLKKGFHYHMFFFFDGSQVWDGEDKARRIGEYWKTAITKGKGLYHNCNANKGSYKYLGTGIIKHDDVKLREDLEKAALYLTKTDYCKVGLIAQKKVRIFGKEEIKLKTNI